MWRVLLLASTSIKQIGGYTGPVMGQSTDCDDAQSRLEVDWNLSDFTVFTCGKDYPLPILEVDDLQFEIPNFDPRTDEVAHKCMNESIEYSETPPLRGEHRPNWPEYGEYLYVPVQRWLHNLEHGSVVLLYHPCVDPAELNKLRLLIRGCLFRHIITPYRNLSEQRPLALVTWGAKLEMSSVQPEKVVAFVRKHGRVAPEDISRQGKYNLFLLKPAVVVSDHDDSQLCPHFNQFNDSTAQ